jgi:hypothetical protein
VIGFLASTSDNEDMDYFVTNYPDLPIIISNNILKKIELHDKHDKLATKVAKEALWALSNYACSSDYII